MSKSISRKKLRDLAFILRCEGMDHCLESHKINDTEHPRTKAATKERGETKRAIAVRIEQLLDGEQA